MNPQNIFCSNPDCPTRGRCSEGTSASPPAPDSDQRAAEIAEVKNFARTPRTTGLAFTVQYGVYGQPASHFLPILQAHDRVLEYHLEHNAP